MALTTAAVVGAAVAVKSSIDAGKSSERAAQVQQEASQAGVELSREQFAQVKEGLQPFITGGEPAFEQQQALSGALGPEAQATAFQQFQESPGTQFLREQGLRLIDTQAAARGGLGGGERLRELTQFSQNLALQDLSGTFNRLGAVSGAGLAAAQALGGVSGQASAVQAGLIGQSGAAQAAGIIGGQRAQAQGLEQVVGQIPGLFNSSLFQKSALPQSQPQSQTPAFGFIPRF